MARHNTYDFPLLDGLTMKEKDEDFVGPDGVAEQIKNCQQKARTSDPVNEAKVDEVNAQCSRAAEAANLVSIKPFLEAGWNIYDIATNKTLERDCGHSAKQDYFNRKTIQEALGVPVNLTNHGLSDSVFEAFQLSGDQAKGMMREDIAYLLDHGVKVHLAYGDRDLICGWMGGERSSIRTPWSRADSFKNAEYVKFKLKRHGPARGLTRQYGNFSFTRIFQGGHDWAMKQPKAAHAWYKRALFNKDIATGKVDITKEPEYISHGTGMMDARDYTETTFFEPEMKST